MKSLPLIAEGKVTFRKNKNLVTEHPYEKHEAYSLFSKERNLLRFVRNYMDGETYEDMRKKILDLVHANKTKMPDDLRAELNRVAWPAYIKKIEKYKKAAARIRAEIDKINMGIERDENQKANANEGARLALDRLVKEAEQKREKLTIKLKMILKVLDRK